MKINIKSQKYFLVIVVLVSVNIFFILSLANSGSGVNRLGQFSELVNLSQDMSFVEASTFFKSLAEEKGGRHAFQALKMANLGPNTDLHLLGHVVGDVLYKQEGVEAITACDNDFRNACSHSVVIGLFNDKGEGALRDIGEACKRAPGGSGAYTMCFHGLGHGILSFEKYDMEKASKVCQKTGTREYGYAEKDQCIGGMIMEIIGGGFHDKDVWSKQRPKYLDKNNPLSICERDFIPKSSKFFCYDYLTPFLFEAVGAQVGNPQPKDFIKAFKYCEQIPKINSVDRDSCFGGFGKEFDGLVQSRDIRQGAINSISAEKLKLIHEWCSLTEDINGEKSCMVHAMNSLYWGGENSRSVSILFCNQAKDDEYRKLCFHNLTNSVSYYVKDKMYRSEYCSEIPQVYSDECRKILSN